MRGPPHFARAKGDAMNTEESVAAHYGRGKVEEQLLGIIKAGGGNPEHFAPADLHGADQLHIGGAAATTRIAQQSGINASTRVLDLGSGTGGVSRHIAHSFGATVHGVDLTPEFVELARSLTARTGLTDQVAFSQGSILSLPFDDDCFDVALLIHVGMNIQDKDTVFAEAARVLRPGGVFAIYDVMLMGGDVEGYPLPWALTADTSFMQPPLAYSDALSQTGFIVDREAKPLAPGIAFLERATSSGGPAGVDLPAMVNLLAAFRSGVLAPVEIYAHLG
ncbi:MULTISPECIES: class I SAM-dependent methyltransferase [Arthrobacter]|uniref:Ubiquinone biosynthesis protein n=1 Tax=Arthrobacter psychrochitiniphilus TaxID=291045 RepID=A0A2V3DW93_9MICC|nr:MULTISPECIES: class I SAM-dependent methyltransferase [Arthrobacter]NYG16264.1 SAM-dependent methyltransferase [Arthrobacter psychrochitiniphilus]PXA69559.1 ubiquinone biosynthesis protein [Arthrobacter psychrochitiniphilus]